VEECLKDQEDQVVESDRGCSWVKILFINSLDAHEKAEQEEWAREEYDRDIDDLRHKEGITEKDIE